MPTQRRALARWFQTTFGASVQHACQFAGFSRTVWHRPGTAKDHTALRRRIREAFTRPRFGASRIRTLFRREGWHVNRKRAHRL